MIKIIRIGITMERIFKLRNQTISFLYKNLLVKIFFTIDPETVHDHMIKAGRFLGSNRVTRGISSLFFNFKDKSLQQLIHGIKFKNPIGLAAGFDKDGVLLNILPSVGFGFAEIGSITAQPCAGNPKPRLWRLKNSQGLMVYFGLNSKGSKIVSDKLRDFSSRIPYGTSVAKTNSPETVDTEDGVQDYVKTFQDFVEVGDYFTINVSCPNSFGGQPFSDPDRLELLLTELDKIETKKPIFIKISPDQSFECIDKSIAVAKRHRIHGFICANLTKNRDNAKIKDELPENGGISGRAVSDMADNLISFVRRETEGKYTIIGVGGVFSAKDAYRKIRLGANLVQLITGMIFEGPQLISQINYDLKQLLKADGFKNISEAVGIDVPITKL